MNEDDAFREWIKRNHFPNAAKSFRKEIEETISYRSYLLGLAMCELKDAIMEALFK